MRAIRTLLADDHKLVLDGLKALLYGVEDIVICGEASTGREVLAVIAADPPDVVVLDINMPDIDGLEATRLIREKHPNVRLLILSMHSEPHFVRSAIELGANGYILKNAGREEFCNAIRTVAGGGTFLGPDLMTILVDGMREPIAAASNHADLSSRELEVLRLIAKEFTTPEIADKLCISAHTVKSHRKNLLSKLQVKNTAGLVLFASEHDLLE